MKRSEGLIATLAGFGPLAFLSIQHAPPGAQPEAFTNEERAQAFRSLLATMQGGPRGEAHGGMLEG